MSILDWFTGNNEPEHTLIAHFNNPPTEPTADPAKNAAYCVRQWLDKNGIRPRRLTGMGSDKYTLVITYIRPTKEQIKQLEDSMPRDIDDYSLRRDYYYSTSH